MAPRRVPAVARRRRAQGLFGNVKTVKHRLLTQLATVAKALGNANRLELLELLAQGERGVEKLASLAGLSLANASQHLQRLAQAGLVVGRKQGQHVYYRLADEAVVDLMAVLRRIAEGNLAEVEMLVDKYLKARDDLEAIAAEDLLRRLREGTVTVIDVRPPEEFSAGHLPSAVNIPLADLEASLDRLPADREIVAYCRGPYCVLAVEAVASLRAKGFKARRLSDGFPEWKRAGLPVTGPGGKAGNDS